MGNRGNIFVEDADVFLYSHWTGSGLAITLRDALKRGKDRWSDSSYLTRIIFCEMLQGDLKGTTGFGISHTMCDNGNPIIYVDPATRTASIAGDASGPLPFNRIVEMSDDELLKWHLGRDSDGNEE